VITERAAILNPRPVAVNRTGLPVMPDPVAVALRVFAPGVAPKVQLPTVAIPLASVTTGTAGRTVPAPPVTAKVTVTPATGVPLRSRTSTEGGASTAAFTGALCVITECAAIWPGVGAAVPAGSEHDTITATAAATGSTTHFVFTVCLL
jgi:hypothetical protein